MTDTATAPAVAPAPAAVPAAAQPDFAAIVAGTALTPPPAPAQAAPTVTANAGAAVYAGDLGSELAPLIPVKFRRLVYTAGYFVSAGLGLAAYESLFPGHWNAFGEIASLSIFAFSHALAYSNTKN